jgi:hypothetical protein
LVGLVIGICLREICIQPIRLQGVAVFICGRNPNLFSELAKVALQRASGNHRSGALIAAVKEMARHL